MQEKYPFNEELNRINYPILPNNLFDTIELSINPNKEKDLKENEINSQIIKGHRVFVLDDNVINLKLMQEILKKFELNVTISSKAKDALDVLYKDSFDVIFIDENMPEMKGSEVIVRIRENEEKNNLTPTVIYGLTGDANEDTKKKIIRSGANDVYTKPIKMKDIFNAIVNGVKKK